MSPQPPRARVRSLLPPVVGLLLAALLLAPAAAQASFPGGNGLIAFVTARDGNNEIYTMTPSGANPVRLTNNAANDTTPEWSADGTKLVFSSNRDGNNEIYTMSADGSGVTRLTNNAADDLDPTWSPDGTRIAFRSNRTGTTGNNDIWVIDADGSSPTNLTGDSGSNFNPDWSPDGSKITYQRFLSGSGVGFGNEVFVVNANGTGKTNLTSNVNTINDGIPSWSPDGARIAFRSNEVDGSHDIYTMNADGTNRQRRTSAPGDEEWPAFAPEDGRLAFHRVSGSAQPELYSIGIGATGLGSSLLRLTDNTVLDTQPSWQADSTAPQTSITSGPADGSSGTDPTPTFAFGSSEANSTFECSLDEAAFGACTSPHTTATLADGEHGFRVRAVDVAGNADPTPAERTFTVDTTAPTTTIDSGPADGSHSNQPDVSFEFSADESGSSFECRLDSDDAGDWEACSSPQDYDGLADGEHSFEVRATDAVGNTGAADSRSFTVDTVAPSVTIDAGPADGATTNQADLSFEFSADESGSSFECRLDSDDAGDWAACVSPRDYEDLADGEHSFEVRATDAAGNVGGPDSRSFTIDTVAPTATIDAGPADGSTTNQADVSFSFAVDETGSSFECRLDSDDAADWETCSSPQGYADLADGEHSFEVRATDGVGNVGAADARSFTVDTTAPTTTIDSGPADGSHTDQTEVTFEFSADEGADFECRLDSDDEADWEGCTSPRDYDALAEGQHSFAVRATDAVGNLGAVESRTFTIDTTAPTTVIDSGPVDGATIAEADVGFEFSADEPGSSFECRLDSDDAADWQACSSPSEHADLADGGHSFEVRAIDAAGNTGGPDSRAFTVDTAAPTTTITAGPDGAIEDRTPSFSFESDEPGSSFECRLDSTDEADWENCSSPREVGPLVNGEHRFEVRAIDAVGNVEQPPTSRTFTVVVPPETTIDAGPEHGSLSTEPAPEFSFSSDDPGAAFQCRVDGDDWEQCESPHTTAPLADGEHSFEVRATDAVGNTGAADARTFTVDTTAPATSIDAGPAPQTPNATPSFEFSAAGATSFECRIDAGSWQECTSPHSVPELADGEHSFEVRGTDAAGNIEDPPAARSFTVDTVAPRAPRITAGPNEGSSVDRSSVSFEVRPGREPGPEPGLECRLDANDAGWTGCASPQAYEDLAEGEHAFAVRARDAAGNIGAVAARRFTVDTTAPITTIEAAPEALTNNATPEFMFNSSQPADFECRLDAAPGDRWAGCRSPYATKSLQDGRHRFEVRAIDAAGNVEQSHPAHAFVVDTVSPETTIESGPGPLTTSATPTFELSSDESGSTFGCRVDGESAPCASPYTTAALADGEHSFEVRATDPAQNTDPTPARHTFVVDTAVSGPVLKGRKRQPQRGRNVAVRIKPRAAERIWAVADGKVKAGKRRFALRTARRSPRHEQGRPLKLKLTRRDSARVRRLLGKRKRKVVAVVRTVITDEAGNSVKLKRRIRLG